jgi:hypothetical protein
MSVLNIYAGSVISNACEKSLYHSNFLTHPYVIRIILFMRFLILSYEADSAYLSHFQETALIKFCNFTPYNGGIYAAGNRCGRYTHGRGSGRR